MTLLSEKEKTQIIDRAKFERGIKELKDRD